MSHRRGASQRPQGTIRPTQHRLSERATSYFRVMTDASVMADGSVQLKRADTVEGVQGAFRLTSAEVIRFAPILAHLAKQLQGVPTCAR